MSPLVNLANFDQYVEDNIKRISELYREIEEVQYRFNDLYGQLLAKWQEQVESTATRLLSADLPRSLQELLAQYEQQEREALQQRISQLERDIADKRAQGEKALRDAQQEIARLRELNPILNEREEMLKARSLSETEAIAKAEADLKASGLLSRLLAKRELKERLGTLRQDHAQTLAELNAVRQEWVQKKKEVEARQTGLRAAWESASVEVSQFQAEADYLSSKLEELARKRGAQKVLTEMTEVAEASGEWRDALTEIVKMNRQLKEYRDGLTNVAEALGVLTGLRNGMERFAQSVAKLYEEQTRFNLKPLKVDLPKGVVEFHNTWAEFRSKVKDEKYLGTHPLEFSRHAQYYAKERLTEPAIQDMFEKMGQALNAAAAAWK